MSREELIPRSVRKLGRCNCSKKRKITRPSPLLSPTFTQSISWTTFTQSSSQCLFFFFFFITPKSMRMCSSTSFHLDGACGGPPSLNPLADPVTTKPHGTRLYHPFQRMGSYTLNQPHECSSDHAAPLPEMRSQRLTASIHPLYGAAHSCRNLPDTQL